MANIKHFDSSLLKIDKKSFKNIDIITLDTSQFKKLTIINIFIV